VAGNGAASQLSVVVCGHRQPQLQRLSNDSAENTVVDNTAVSHQRLHQDCCHSATKCSTQCDYSPSDRDSPRGRGTSPVLVSAMDVVGATDRRTHVVIDALRTTRPSSDNVEHRIQRLPTSQIICRIIQPSTADRRRSEAEWTSSKRKTIIPVCDERRRISATAARTGLTKDYCRSQSHSRQTTQRLLQVDANGNKQQ